MPGKHLKILANTFTMVSSIPKIKIVANFSSKYTTLDEIIRYKLMYRIN